METKRCSKCGEEKLLTEFYEMPKAYRRGATHRGQCKECMARYAHERYKKIGPQLTPYYREYRKKNRDKYRAKDRRFYRNHRESELARGSEYYRKYPEKNRAHKAVQIAIERGEIVKPSTCSKCGEPHKNIQGHHEDYSKPLDVIWLCPPCHGELHRDSL